MILPNRFATFFMVMNMQMNRLFEIVYILLAHPTITAKELAERFEVSTRTIYRDIEALSSAGIPVYMSQGKGGGIRLLDNFVLNKAMLTEEEQAQILSSLHGIQAATGEKGDLLSKLSMLFHKENENWIEIDFSDWSGKEQRKFQDIKNAILSHTVIVFDYFGRTGEKTRREVKPLKLYFRDKTWYLSGYCMQKEGMRQFKLRRMKQLEMTKVTFEPLDIPMKADASPEHKEAKESAIVLKVDASLAYRVYDEFLEEQIQVLQDHSFLVTLNYIEDEWVYGLILSFGCYAHVVEPERVKKLIQGRLEKALGRYDEVKGG